ncbi:hypothetical protein J2Z69_000120 [Paenibacillus shirakamiensis]|uniref:Uncharacterized protein n=1 Tax=Paenibacillus shirakamiensis TaxID=1265935 RepID=A0ABS4JBK8_9BACL|nr:hypothetical protein [Paenibacillus shirakamiensis]
MNFREQIFTEDVLEEIKLAKELCQDMKVNGLPLQCFALLHSLLIEESTSYDKSILLSMYAQIKDYNDYWKEIHWFDNSKMELILVKFKKLIK